MNEKGNKESYILERLFDKAVGFAIGFATNSAIGPAIDLIIGSVIGSTTGLECLTRGQLSFKVGEGVQSTAVKDFYLSVSS